MGYLGHVIPVGIVMSVILLSEAEAPTTNQDGVVTSEQTTMGDMSVTQSAPVIDLLDNITTTPDQNYTTEIPEVEIEVNVSKETAAKTSNNTRSFLELLLSNMDVRIRPISDEDGGPVSVYVDFHLLSFSSISEVNMDYKVDVFFRETWVDKRLAFDPDDIEGDSVTLTRKPTEQIWTPDLFFPNEKKGDFHDVTVDNIMVKIEPSGKVKYSVRLTLTMSCLMRLSAFPMDSQICPFEIESYSYSTDELMLFWKPNPVELKQGLSLPQFTLEAPVETTTCTKDYRTGTYPCLEARFHLSRHIGFYLLQTYVPSGLIIILSWVSFWINMDAVPARVSLSVTTVMTMVAQLAGSKTSIPRVSYPKAVDVWMTMGMVFVFVALIEYALVNSLDRKDKKQKALKSKQGDKLFDQLTDTSDDDHIDPKFDYRARARMVDKGSRILFPVSFAIFNVLYWPLYLNLHVTE